VLSSYVPLLSFVIRKRAEELAWFLVLHVCLLSAEVLLSLLCRVFICWKRRRRRGRKEEGKKKRKKKEEKRKRGEGERERGREERGEKHTASLL
jgi:hypothetical protein